MSASVSVDCVSVCLIMLNSQMSDVKDLTHSNP